MTLSGMVKEEDMRNIAIVTLAIVALAALPAAAQQTRTFDWEDGTSDALGVYGNCTVENSTEQAHGGTHSLKVIETPLGGTPQAFVWWVTGLVDGDQITASFWVYDDTVDASPSGRIWGHYTDAVDVTSYTGSASGNSTYSDGLGWSELSYTWTFDGTDPTHLGLVVEARIYAGAEFDAIYVDDASITVTSTADPAPVIYAPDGSVPVELMAFDVE